MRLRVALVSVMSLVAGLVAASPAAALVYWADGSTIKRATNGGAGAHVFIEGAGEPCGLAVNGTHVFWADRTAGRIGRANVDGGGANPSFIDTRPEACGVDVNASHVFWAANGTIGRATLAGGAADHDFILNGGSFICGVAVNSTRIFWANESSGRVGSALLNGTSPNHNYITGAGIPCGVAVNATHVYWTNQGFESVGRAAVSGLSVNQTLVQSSIASSPCGVAVSSSNLYWANNGGNTIGRAGLDGSSPNESLISSGVSGCGVAVDGLGLPAQTFKLGKAQLNKKKGTANLVVEAEWPGTLQASGKGMKKVTKAAAGPGNVTLPIRVKGKAKKKLAKSGKAAVKVKVVHSPDGGSPSSAKKKVKLVRK